MSRGLETFTVTRTSCCRVRLDCIILPFSHSPIPILSFPIPIPFPYSHVSIPLNFEGVADAKNLQPMYSRLHTAIRKYDDKHIIFFEPTVMISSVS